MLNAIFIGSGEASLLERKTLINSLRKNCKGAFRLVVFNGTHNSLEEDGFAPVLAPMSLKAKYFNVTEFSNYRFLIPQLCNYQGRAIYLDSDMICLADIDELFEANMDGFDFLAKEAAYGASGEKRWGLSVTLFDCSRCRFDLEQYVTEIEDGLYSFADLHQMSPKFLSFHPFKIGSIDPRWNEFDQFNDQTRLIHYTNLQTQPWKFSGHPHFRLWFDHFLEAKNAGFVTDQDIQLSLARGYVRRDILTGKYDSPVPFWKRILRRLAN